MFPHTDRGFCASYANSKITSACNGIHIYRYIRLLPTTGSTRELPKQKCHNAISSLLARSNSTKGCSFCTFVRSIFIHRQVKTRAYFCFHCLALVILPKEGIKQETLLLPHQLLLLLGGGSSSCHLNREEWPRARRRGRGAGLYSDCSNKTCVVQSFEELPRQGRGGSGHHPQQQAI